jgi:hypothetical protein
VPSPAWLNEVEVALAELGLTEQARNTGTEVGGVAIEGDIGLEDDRFVVYVTLFGNSQQAHHAELGLRANPSTRSATSRGLSAVKTVGRVVYVANGRGSVVDEFRVDEVVHAVGGIALPPPLNIADDAASRTKATSATHPSAPSFAQVSRQPRHARAAAQAGGTPSRRRAERRRVRSQEGGAAPTHLTWPPWSCGPGPILGGMASTWVLQTATKGTGANMVPLERVTKRASTPEPLSVPRKPQPRTQAPKRRLPRRFTVTDVMSGQNLVDDVSTAEAIDVLKGVRSIVDVNLYVWREERRRWRLLTFPERRAMFDLAAPRAAGRCEP